MTTAAALTLWIPRLAGLATAVFLSLFALDAFNGRPLAEALPAFLIHLTPAFLVLAVVALAWRWPFVGAVACAALAVGYGIMVHGRFDWIAAISGPLTVLAVLFLISGLRRAA